ncbi:hypothetical protein BGZ94_010102 [Podila epigama]|nr:hypothetical protein BGZ94_010102 [Podila epigama]
MASSFHIPSSGAFLNSIETFPHDYYYYNADNILTTEGFPSDLLVDTLDRGHPLLGGNTRDTTDSSDSITLTHTHSNSINDNIQHNSNTDLHSSGGDSVLDRLPWHLLSEPLYGDPLPLPHYLPDAPETRTGNPMATPATPSTISCDMVPGEPYQQQWPQSPSTIENPSPYPDIVTFTRSRFFLERIPIRHQDRGTEGTALALTTSPTLSRHQLQSTIRW